MNRAANLLLRSCSTLNLKKNKQILFNEILLEILEYETLVNMVSV